MFTEEEREEVRDMIKLLGETKTIQTPRILSSKILIESGLDKSSAPFKQW